MKSVHKFISYGIVMHFSDKIFLLCFLFLLSAPIAVVTEVLEEAGGPVPQNRMQDSIQFF